VKLAYTFSSSDSLSNIRSCLRSPLFSVIDLEIIISSSAISGFLSVSIGAVVQCSKPSWTEFKKPIIRNQFLNKGKFETIVHRNKSNNIQQRKDVSMHPQYCQLWIAENSGFFKFHYTTRLHCRNSHYLTTFCTKYHIPKQWRFVQIQLRYSHYFPAPTHLIIFTKNQIYLCWQKFQ